MEFKELRFKATLRVLVQKEQFAYWLKKIFYLNNSLYKECDPIYQSMFYIVISELFGEGELYLNEIVNVVVKQKSPIRKEWYLRLQKGIKEMKAKFSESELYFIDYKRHNFCHIFQDAYEEVQRDGRVKKDRVLGKGPDGKPVKKTLRQISAEFHDILLRYGGDEGFDMHMNTILYPIIDKLYVDLQTIHEEEMNEL